MQDYINLFGNPAIRPLLKLVVGVVLFYYGYSAFAGALPMPNASSGMFYRWFFRFNNLFAGNLSRVAASLHVPGAKEDADLEKRGKDDSAV